MQNKDFVKIGLKDPQKIVRMKTGSCSVNYYVLNADGEFLVKFLSKTRTRGYQKLHTHLGEISGKPYCPQFIRETVLGRFHVFILKWAKGKSHFLETLSADQFQEVLDAYLGLLKTISTATQIKPAMNLKAVYRCIKNPPRFLKPDLQKIRQEIKQPATSQIIHGDFHYKNMIFNDGKLNCFLDFECLTWGCPPEDLIRLLLTNAEQHVFFRERYTLKLLKTILKQTHFSCQEWFYGMDVFVLQKYRKKLKHRTLLKTIGLYRCNHLYRRMRKMIEEFTATP